MVLHQLRVDVMQFSHTHCRRLADIGILILRGGGGGGGGEREREVSLNQIRITSHAQTEMSEETCPSMVDYEMGTL